MSVQACADLVARGDGLRFRTIMAGPLPAREALFPLHAMLLEAARAPWVTKEAMIAEMRLQWWRDVCEEIASGAPARAHEVAAPLAALFAQAPELARDLDRAVAVRQWDIYPDPFENEGEFTDYIAASAGDPAWVAARLLGADAGDGAGEGAVRDLAYAGGLARFFMAVPGLEAAGRRPMVDGRAAVVAALAGAALARAQAAKGAVRALGLLASAPLIDAMVHLPILAQAARDPGRVAAGALGQGPMAQSWRIFRAGSARRW